jgi:hypothetical protein
MMRVILHPTDGQTLTRLRTSEAQIRDVLHQVSEGGGPPWLLIALYLPAGVLWSGKTYGAVHTPSMFREADDHWQGLAQRWPAPTTLPDRYRLIRLQIGQDTPYPFNDTDAYGWAWTFPSFASQLAVLARHELEHIWHPQHDEHLASRWALDVVQRRLGYSVRATLPAEAVPAPHRTGPGPAWDPWRKWATVGVGPHRIRRIARRRRR